MIGSDGIEDKIELPGDSFHFIFVFADESTLREKALDEIADQLDGKEPRRVIIIPGRMINIVI